MQEAALYSVYAATNPQGAYNHMHTSMMAGLSNLAAPIIMAYDGYQEIVGLFSHFASKSSLARNAVRMQKMDAFINDFQEMNLPGKVETIAAGVTGAVESVVTGRGFGGIGFFGAKRVNSGGRQLLSVRASLNAEREAIDFYNYVRISKSNTDVIQISKNAGIPEYRIQRIKEHTFINKHTLPDGRVAQFDSDIEISDAWIPLQNGNFVEQDIQLLHHEYFESRFEGIFKTDYTTAHRAANNSGRTWDPNEFISPKPTINRRY